jgi:hypothetical protein
MHVRNESRRQGRRLAEAIAPLFLVILVGGGAASGQVPKVTPPQPTVPEIFTLQGQYVRIAYNNEGFASLGYRMAQEEIGKEWMLLEMGITLRKPTPDYRLKREDISITTPDGKTIPLATQMEYSEGMGAVRNLTQRAKVIRDSIDYFPLDADQVCAIQFFAEIGGSGRQLAFNDVELDWHRACLGRLFFRVPGGIKVGQHWLNIRFANSAVQVPFRILTPEEEKQLRKYWEDIKKEHEKALNQ